MAHETRVNLRHLLEDMRDTYAAPLEEIIITELVANALDGKAKHIHFEVNTRETYLRCVDDGIGMKRTALKNYHDIAASTKTRGTGIGFAGVGAKLALLLAEKVVTESRGGHGSKSAAEWHLASPYRAPWKFVPSRGTVTTPRGTSVTIYFNDRDSHLLQPDFIEKTVLKHFYPLLSEQFYHNVLRYFYKKPVSFSVDNTLLRVSLAEQKALAHWFRVHIGKSRQTAGYGFLVKTDSRPGFIDMLLGHSPAIREELPSGLWIATFGKVIKGGWEWLGILPKNPEGLAGIVEVPALSEILTTNKSDFLSDAASLKKYYRIRKAIQEAVLPILENLGESHASVAAPSEQSLKPISKMVTDTLTRMIDDFPELESLIGAHRHRTRGKKKIENQNTDSSAAMFVEKEEHAQDVRTENDKNTRTGSGKDSKETPSVPTGTANTSSTKMVRAKQAGLKLALAEMADSSGMLLGRIVDDTITVNISHPAWKKAKQKGLGEYHILATIALELSRYIETEKSPQDFFNHLLLSWAKEAERGKEKKLF